MATVVILGGGVGGLVAANRLRRRLDPKHRVVLVNRHAQHVPTTWRRRSPAAGGDGRSTESVTEW